MSLLKKLEAITEGLDDINEVGRLILYFKRFLRRRFGEYFTKVTFDNTDNDNGILFIKFAKKGYKDATNETLSDSTLNFIIGIEGFDADGSFEPQGIFDIDLVHFKDDANTVTPLESQRFYHIDDAKKYILDYIHDNEEKILDEEGEAVATGTSSGATGHAEGGADRTVGSIAVHPYKHGVYKRSGKVKQKKDKREIKESDETQNVGVLPFYYDESDRLFVLLKFPSQGNTDENTEVNPEVILDQKLPDEEPKESVFRVSKEGLGVSKQDILNYFKLVDSDAVGGTSVYAVRVRPDVPLYSPEDGTEKVKWFNDLEFDGLEGVQKAILDSSTEALNKQHGENKKNK